MNEAPERDNPAFVYLIHKGARVCTDKGEEVAREYLASHVGHKKFRMVRVTGCAVVGYEHFKHFDYTFERDTETRHERTTN